MSQITSINDTASTIDNQTQLDLFALVDAPGQQLVNGKKVVSAYSNSIGSIDLIPRFKRGTDAVVPVDKHSGKLVIENHYTAGRNKLVCKIQPAVITRKVDGEEKEFHAWPGDREDLIEKVLFLIASNKGLEIIRTPAGVNRYGIYFTLYEIREQLKRIGKTRPYDVIRESLLVIRDSRTSIAQRDGDKEISITHDIFADAVLEVTGTGRGRDRCFITFSDYVIEEIQKLNYRQYPFASINSHETPLARFIHQYLTNNWTNAVVGGQKNIYVTELFNAFGKDHLSMTVKRRDLRAALQILVDSGWFLNVPYSKKENLAGGKTDYSYLLTATDVFVSEVIKANAKKKGLRELNDNSLADPNYTLPRPVGSLG